MPLHHPSRRLATFALACLAASPLAIRAQAAAALPEPASWARPGGNGQGDEIGVPPSPVRHLRKRKAKRQLVEV